MKEKEVLPVERNIEKWSIKSKSNHPGKKRDFYIHSNMRKSYVQSRNDKTFYLHIYTCILEKDLDILLFLLLFLSLQNSNINYQNLSQNFYKYGTKFEFQYFDKLSQERKGTYLKIFKSGIIIFEKFKFEINFECGGK